ncbi:MAG TPA: aminotransferase class I/II-fold pyridoxal phosphate-dependent enzyme [Nitrososphaerales archaeon]|nr:aminotransferase class I/II-fold pyridoxal phosphate-dependent enzyme [Nitrososphaerales archaeon]
MSLKNSLALYGGKPVRANPLPVMHPGATYFDDEETRAVLEVLKAQSPYRFYGPKFLNITGKFEEEFRKYAGVKYALAVSSGTAALHTALVGLGVGPGDEVILPAYAWISCPSAIVAAKGTPVLANIDKSLTLDPKDVEKKITKKTKVIMAVHIRGTPCDLDSLKEISKDHGVLLLEDVAQCGGGSYHGRKLGSIGVVGSFSFQLNKMISAGEGGACVTNDKKIFERMLMLHDVGTPFRGSDEKDFTLSIDPFPGLNYRQNEISSAILRAQLKKLDKIVAKIRANKSKVKKGISGIGGIEFRKQPDPKGEIGVGLVFFAKTPQKAILFRNALLAENIITPSGSYPGVMYDPSKSDGHVFTSWGHLVPRVSQLAKKELKPSLDLLSRAVHIDISPLDTDKELNDIIKAVKKVADVVL